MSICRQETPRVSSISASEFGAGATKLLGIGDSRIEVDERRTAMARRRWARKKKKMGRNPEPERPDVLTVDSFDRPIL